MIFNEKPMLLQVEDVEAAAGTHVSADNFYCKLGRHVARMLVVAVLVLVLVPPIYDGIPHDPTTSRRLAVCDVDTVIMSNVYWGHENEWRISDSDNNLICSGGSYQSHQVKSEPCCLTGGTGYTLTCLDSWGDGWNGGSIKIQEVEYCGYTDFPYGSRKEQAITITPVGTCEGPPECLGKSADVCQRMEEQEKKCTWTGKKATEGCTGAPECLGKSEAICKRMMQQEGKCSWTPPTCAPLFGKSDLRQKGQWCYHVKSQGKDVCQNSYVSLASEGDFKPCVWNDDKQTCKSGDVVQCAPPTSEPTP